MILFWRRKRRADYFEEPVPETAPAELMSNPVLQEAPLELTPEMEIVVSPPPPTEPIADNPHEISRQKYETAVAEHNAMLDRERLKMG